MTSKKGGVWRRDECIRSDRGVSARSLFLVKRKSPRVLGKKNSERGSRTLTLHRRRTDGWRVRGQFASGGGARGRGRDGVGWRARRVRAVAGGAGDASEASGSPARVLDADAARVLFPTRKAKPCRRRFRESDRCAGAIDAGNARAPLGWGTYVVDVRDDGHVTDVVLLVHLTTELVDRELRGEGERWRSGRRLALGLLACRVAERRKKHMSRHHRSRLRGFGTPREVGRDARARARERSGRTFTMVAGVQLSARLFTGCVEQRGRNADRRAFYLCLPPTPCSRRESLEIYTVHSTSSDRKTLSKIQNLRTEILRRSCGASDFLERFCLRVAARRESLGPR